MRITFAVFFLLSFLDSVYAQPYIDILNIHGQWSNPGNRTSDDSLKKEIRYFSIDCTVPIKIKKDVLVLSPFLADIQLSGSEVNSIVARSIALPLGFVKQWKNERIKTSFVLISRVNKDPEISFTNNAVQWGGVVLHTIQKHDRLKFKFGLYYNSEFFGPFFMPLAGIDWKVSDRLNIFGVLPGSMNLEYLLRKWIHIGLAYRSYTNSFRQANNSFLYINDNHLKAVADIYITPKHLITFEAGHSILRTFKTGYRIEGKSIYTKLNIDDGYLLKIGYAFRFRLDSSN